jgi:DNA mismatch repair ATPase MutS
LDLVDNNQDERHFCAFDELYSGTNPEEAELSAVAFMKYITKNKNVFCMLTTHFIKICKKLQKTKMITNYKMSTEKSNNSLIYKYILEEGISNIKGGINVLQQMNYPIEIINNTINNSFT